MISYCFYTHGMAVSDDTNVALHWFTNYLFNKINIFNSAYPRGGQCKCFDGLLTGHGWHGYDG